MFENPHIRRLLFYIGVATLGIILFCFFLVASSMALEISSGYVYTLQGQTLTNYTENQITLSNGSVIILDNANISRYLPQVKRELKTSQPQTLYSSHTDYSIYLNQSENYSAWDPKNSTRINQGDCVQLGDTINIAGTGWYTGFIAYYGRYYDGYSDDYSVSAVNITKIMAWNLTKFYIDPDYFAQYPGWWYVYYPSDQSNNESSWGHHGNDRLFYLGGNCQKPNTTIAEKEVIDIQEIYRQQSENLSRLPEKKSLGADYIIPRNESSTLPAPEKSRAWVFGRTMGIYDRSIVNSSLTLSIKETANMESGSYDISFVVPDALGIYEQEYDASTKSITSPFTLIKPTYVGDLQPKEVESRFQNLIK